MAILFIPEDLELHKLTKDNPSMEAQNTILETDNDFGLHSRVSGTATVETLKITCYIWKENLSLFRQWTDLARGQVFYSTFPDPEYPEIEKDKFYAFSFVNTNFSKTYLTDGYYSTDLELYWHFRVPGTTRV